MTWKVDDTEPPLTGTVTSSGTALDVTVAEAVDVHIHRPDGTVLNRPAVVTSPGTGAWSFPWETGDLNTRGTYRVEVQITWPGGRPQTTPTVLFSVADQIA